MTHSEGQREPVEQLAEEFLERHRRGEQPSVSEYSQKYPDLADEIRDVFPALLVLEEVGPRNVDPLFSGTGAGDSGPLRQLGDYRILREIGRGGMGIVYEAEHQALGRRVALKILPPRSALDALCLERFHREARAAAKLHHTNIVPVFDVGAFLGVHYFAMQFIDGQGLDQVLGALQQLRERSSFPAGDSSVSARLAASLRTGWFEGTDGDEPTIAPGLGDATPSRSGQAVGAFETVAFSGAGMAVAAPLTSPPGFSSTVDVGYYASVARIGLQVAGALAHAHGQNVLHRDIKPANLLLDLQGTVWVTDFGLAKEEGQDLTRTGDVVGTLRYMAPERFTGRADARSDVYSLGLTLYELLCLRPAFDETDRGRLLKQIAETEPVRPTRMDPRIPRDLETIVQKAIAKEPGQRYLWASDLADDLQRFLTDRPIRARRLGPGERLWRWCRRNKAVAALVAFSAVFLLSLAGVCLVAAVWLRQARDDTAAQKIQADQNFALAKKAVEDFLTKVTQDKRLTQTDLHSLRKELLQSALPFYEEFARQKTDDPQMEAERGRAYHRLGEVRQALGETEPALANYQEMLAIFTALAQRYPEVPDYQKWRAGALNRIGALQLTLGRLDQVEAAWREALTVEEQLVASHPEVADYRLLLAKNHNNLGVILLQTGRPAQAEEEFREALQHHERLALEFPEVVEYRQTVGSGHLNRALNLAQSSRPTEAEAEFQAAIATLTRLCDEHPAVVDNRSLLGRVHNEYGNLLLSVGRRDDAMTAYQNGVHLQEKLVADFPKIPAYRGFLAAGYHNVAHVLSEAGRKEEAVAIHRKALDLYQRLAADFPTEPERRADVIMAQANLGLVLAELGQPREAEDACRAGIAMGEKLIVEFPKVSGYRRLLGSNYDVLGESLWDQDRRQEAVDAYRHAVAVFEGAPQQADPAPDWVNNLAAVYRSLGHMTRELGRPAEGLAWYTKALGTLEPLFAKNASATWTRSNMRRALEGRALTLEVMQRHADALPDWERAGELGDAADKMRCRLLAQACGARAGKASHDRGLTEASALVDSPDATGDVLFAAARACAVSCRLATDDSRLAEAYGGRAVELLAKARARGYFNDSYHVVMVKRERDLVAIRLRSDYVKFIQGLERDQKATSR
jgi:serine/threonine protein kinase/tetratricopeptide (TPR) repeat protein